MKVCLNEILDVIIYGGAFFSVVATFSRRVLFLTLKVVSRFRYMKVIIQINPTSRWFNGFPFLFRLLVKTFKRSTFKKYSLFWSTLYIVRLNEASPCFFEFDVEKFSILEKSLLKIRKLIGASNGAKDSAHPKENKCDSHQKKCWGTFFCVAFWVKPRGHKLVSYFYSFWGTPKAELAKFSVHIIHTANPAFELAHKPQNKSRTSRAEWRPNSFV